MRIFTILLLITVSLSAVPAQNREQAIEELTDLRRQGENYEKIILSPSKDDIEAAKQKNVNVFRILPREVYDKGFFVTRGGGAYYSFYFRIPDYGHGSDIELAQDNFSVGFAGADYGFITDLGDVSLSNFSKTEKGVNYLISYKPPTEEPKAREEYRRLGRTGFEIDGVKFQNRISAIVGHTYVMRSVNYGNSDILVAFKVYRRDTDGSLIIFWRLIEQFETPTLNSSRKIQAPDAEILKSTQGWLRSDYFSGVQAEVSNGVTTLRGTIAKDKLAYAIQLANNSGATKVLNFLTVK